MIDWLLNVYCDMGDNIHMIHVRVHVSTDIIFEMILSYSKMCNKVETNTVVKGAYFSLQMPHWGCESTLRVAFDYLPLYVIDN